MTDLPPDLAAFASLPDAQPAIRGKCPLELAGYDLSQLPVATLWNGLSIEWPLEVVQNDVPNR